MKEIFEGGGGLDIMIPLLSRSDLACNYPQATYLPPPLPLVVVTTYTLFWCGPRFLINHQASAFFSQAKHIAGLL